MSDAVYTLTNVIQRANDRTLLELESLRVGRGEILGLKGHNGAGKSTLLHILALLERPASGEFLFMGRPADPDDLEQRRRVTMLTQEPFLLARKVRANVAYGLRLRGEAPAGRVDEALTMVNLDPAEFGARQWNELSGGEAQRVALAARLALRPQVLLLDEPTANLDTESTRAVREATVAAREKWGTTLVIAAHDHRWLRETSDRVLTLEQGRPVPNGTRR